MEYFYNEDIDYILDELINEGYVDDYKSAFSIFQVMSEDWLNDLLQEKYVKAMDPKGAGRDRRASIGDLPRGQKRRSSSTDNHNYWSGGHKSPVTRRRKEIKNRTRGGFNA